MAPQVNLAARMARMDVGRTYSFGMGQFKAPNAMPALVEMPVTERREALIEMAQLEEMHRINSEQWMRLQSNDENIRNAEGLDVVTRGQILRRRLERLTEWMRWQAFVNGSLTITYPRTNSQLVIDYGWLAGHKPVPRDALVRHDQQRPGGRHRGVAAAHRRRLGPSRHEGSPHVRVRQEHPQQREAEDVLQRPGRAGVPRHARPGGAASRRGHHVRHPRRGLPPDGVGCGS
jgi:hypothetical protein